MSVRENIISFFERGSVKSTPQPTSYPLPKTSSKHVRFQIFVEFGLENTATLGEGFGQKITFSGNQFTA